MVHLSSSGQTLPLLWPGTTQRINFVFGGAQVNGEESSESASESDSDDEPPPRSPGHQANVESNDVRLMSSLRGASSSDGPLPASPQTVLQQAALLVDNRGGESAPQVMTVGPNKHEEAAVRKALAVEGLDVSCQLKDKTPDEDGETAEDGLALTSGCCTWNTFLARTMADKSITDGVPGTELFKKICELWKASSERVKFEKCKVKLQQRKIGLTNKQTAALHVAAPPPPPVAGDAVTPPPPVAGVALLRTDGSRMGCAKCRWSLHGCLKCSDVKAAALLRNDGSRMGCAKCRWSLRGCLKCSDVKATAAAGRKK